MAAVVGEDDDWGPGLQLRLAMALAPGIALAPGRALRGGVVQLGGIRTVRTCCNHSCGEAEKQMRPAEGADQAAQHSATADLMVGGSSYALVIYRRTTRGLEWKEAWKEASSEV